MVPSFSKANDMGYLSTILMWQMYLHTREVLYYTRLLKRKIPLGSIFYTLQLWKDVSRLVRLVPIKKTSCVVNKCNKVEQGQVKIW